MAVRYGRYEVLYKLGQGAMAQVFLARDPVLSRFVAIKVLHADLASRRDVLQRFFNEARTVAAIRSPHVVEVFDFGQEGRDLYLVMEFVDGMSLHALLRHAAPKAPDVPAARHPVGESGPVPGAPGIPLYEPLPPAVAAALVCQAADGLCVAAAHGVVHRDLKPENLILNTRGYLKISDFGIAHVQDDSLTKTGAVLGSPLYMSPEQARGLKPITAQSDLFSLGAVLYAALAGYPPFRARSVTELFRLISAEPHRPLARLRPDLHPGLSDLVDTLLRKRPEERGGGPRWLLRRLQDFLMAQGIRDPAEAVAGYLRELGERGAQTTWKTDGRNATLPLTMADSDTDADSLSVALQLLPVQTAPASRARSAPASPFPAAPLPAAPLPTRGRSRPKGQSRKTGPLAGIAMALAILGLGAGLGAWGWSVLRGAAEPGSRSGRTGLRDQGAEADRPGPAQPGLPAQAAAPGGADGDARGPGAVASAADPGNLAVTDPGPARGDARSAGNGGGTGARAGGEAGSGHGRAAGPGEPGASTANEGKREAMEASVAGASANASATASGAALGAAPGAGGKAAESILILKSSPPFSETYLDGRFMGTTPVRIASLPPGPHRLAMKSARLPGFDTSIQVGPGIHALKIHLEAGAGLRVAATSADGD